ncbi:MAG: MaoC family dehydratase [Dehalococcoidia bacterium]
MSDTQVQYDASVIGVEVEIGEAFVDPAHIAAYCAAIGDTNPLFIDADAAANGPYGTIVAPPAFVMTLPATKPGLDPKVVYGNTTFNAGQHCDFLLPLRAGDTVKITQAVKEIYEKTGRSGSMLFVVRRNTYTNQDGEVVAVVDGSTVHRTVERG